MSIGPMGIVGSLAGSQRAQARGADGASERQSHDNQVRQAGAERQAEKAAGIGETEGDQAAGDRDADGRRLWEVLEDERDDASERDDPSAEASDSPPPAKSADPDCGGRLDVEG